MNSSTVNPDAARPGHKPPTPLVSTYAPARTYVSGQRVPISGIYQRVSQVLLPAQARPLIAAMYRSAPPLDPAARSHATRVIAAGAAASSAKPVRQTFPSLAANRPAPGGMSLGQLGRILEATDYRPERSGHLYGYQGGMDSIAEEAPLRMRGMMGGTFTPQAAPPVIPAGFAVTDRNEVAGFLQRHPEAATALRESWAHVRAVFGPARVSLRVIRDPDSGDVEDLYAYIQVLEAAGSALDKLDQFDEGWWMDRLADRAASLHFDLEYV